MSNKNKKHDHHTDRKDNTTAPEVNAEVAAETTNENAAETTDETDEHKEIGDNIAAEETVAEEATDITDETPAEEATDEEEVTDAPAADVTAETAPAAKVLPEVLKPTPPPSTAGSIAAKRKVRNTIFGMPLKDFYSLGMRMAQPGDVDCYGVQVPLDEKVFFVMGKDRDKPGIDIKAMPLKYENETILAEDGVTVLGVRRIGYKTPKIRKAVNGLKKIDGEMVEKYKQHTLVVEVPNEEHKVLGDDGVTMVPRMVGAVAYWDTLLEAADYEYLAAKSQKEIDDRKARDEKKAALKIEKEEKAKLAAAEALAAANKKAAEVVATGAEAGSAAVAEALAAAGATKQKVGETVPAEAEAIETE